MKTRAIKWTGRGGLFAAIVLTCGCMGSLGLGYSEVYVDVAPPPPRVEVVGVAPYEGAIYVQGHYYPEGRGYVWHPGNWTRGRPGQHYVQHRVERAGDGRYRYKQGHWRN